MNIIEIIKNKRDKKELTKKEIDFFISELVQNKIPDYQLSALLMAMFINDLSINEMINLTISMAHSGEMLDLSEIPGIKADKHSTGGIGDKTTLIITPVLASLGISIAKMSGRGLGITGGTIDKLESIPGFRTELSGSRFIEQIRKTGAAVSSQSINLAPADKIMYSMRDVTCTVDNIGLIASSIMSKKLAGGADIILLDVKCGSGAFMPDIESAKKLAEIMVRIGKDAGRKTAAIITDMNAPLGHCVGNSLEVVEAVETLKGNAKGELLYVCKKLCAYILLMSGKTRSISEGENLVLCAIESGQALDKFREIISMQGGNPQVTDNYDLFEKCLYKFEIKAENEGYINFINAGNIGMASVLLGAGRMKKNEKIDFGAGIVFKVQNNSYVEKGGKIAEGYTNRKDKIESATQLIRNSFETNSRPKEVKEHILDEII